MRRLRALFPEELVVIGVHSPKFPTEKITANVRAAVARHGIEHPVVNDADFAIWNEYAVRAWPTLVLIDPQGKIVGQQAGEISADDFAQVIGAMVEDFGAQGLINHIPLPGLEPPTDKPPQLLEYPSKLLLASGGRLFVSDTGHNRILEVQLSLDGLSGELVRVFGTGEPGLTDGHITAARLSGPHGLALVEAETGATLYVADTENHAIRAVDLVRETVATVAGTGEIGRALRDADLTPTAVDLRSPWALVAIGDLLFIAMAGSHQVWVLIEQNRLAVFAGNGREALVDGPRYEASFNQPSDLVLDMGHLFVVDAEASAIRAISLQENAQVHTLIGQGLFEFGDIDGTGADVRLQHPTGLCSDGQLIYIADSYNHKIKTLDPATGAVQSLIGTGEPGSADGDFAEATLYEPEGVAFTDGRLYIADTNNHLIRVADLTTRQVHTLALS
ncbi:MAG: alkyl hydroperoxide reductase [Caldilineaceae bacterium]|nr:alkyl hydroperoxide reductase [Caldilineaceae bacterium]